MGSMAKAFKLPKHSPNEKNSGSNKLTNPVKPIGKNAFTTANNSVQTPPKKDAPSTMGRMPKRSTKALLQNDAAPTANALAAKYSKPIPDLKVLLVNLLRRHQKAQQGTEADAHRQRVQHCGLVFEHFPTG